MATGESANLTDRRNVDVRIGEGEQIDAATGRNAVLTELIVELILRAQNRLLLFGAKNFPVVPVPQFSGSVS